MSKDLVVGIDSSTTATKVIAWDATGTAVAQGRSSIELNSPQPNYYEQDPADWWGSTCKALLQLTELIDANRISAISISNQRETFAPFDANFEPLRPAIVWLDERCKPLVQWLADKVGAQRIHAITGKPVDVTPVIYRLAWMAHHEPELLRQAATICDVHAYLAQRLCDERKTSWASADPLGCLDMVEKTWSREILSELDLDPDNFPQPVAPGSIIGEVTSKAALATGLLAGTPLVAGGGDGQCAGLGCAILDSEHAYLNLGTAVVAGVYDESYRADPAFRTMSSCTEKGFVYESCLRSGTFLLNWLVEDIFAVDPTTDKDIYTRLEAAAARIPIGSEGLRLVPYWGGCMTPYWEMEARGSIIGLSGAHGQAHLYRAMMEGIALEQALVTSRIESVTATSIQSYFAIGGGAASDLWCQIIADATDKIVERLATVEASNLGAGMCAAVGAGWFDSFPTAARAMRGAVVGQFSPDCDRVARYQEVMASYQEVHPRVSDLFPRINASLVGS